MRGHDSTAKQLTQINEHCEPYEQQETEMGPETRRLTNTVYSTAGQPQNNQTFAPQESQATLMPLS